MAPRLTPKEQYMATMAVVKKKSTKQIFDIIKLKREKEDVAMVDITNLCRFLRGHTHKRGAKETCGRKAIYSRKNVLAMNAARHKFMARETTCSNCSEKGTPGVAPTLHATMHA